MIKRFNNEIKTAKGNIIDLARLGLCFPFSYIAASGYNKIFLKSLNKVLLWLVDYIIIIYLLDKSKSSL